MLKLPFIPFFELCEPLRLLRVEEEMLRGLRGGSSSSQRGGVGEQEGLGDEPSDRDDCDIAEHRG